MPATTAGHTGDETMMGLLEKIGTLLRRARELMASAAKVAYDAVDISTAWIWALVADRNKVAIPAPEAYDEGPEIASPATDDETLEAGLRIVGEQSIRAAKEILAYGEVRSGDIGVDVAMWLQNLSREEVSAIAHGDELTVGRHVAGLDPVLDILGDPICRPEPEEDRARDKRRLHDAEERRLEEQAAFARVARQRERELSTDRPALLPGIAA